MTSGTIERPGARIAYDDSGGDGLAVVLIHGFGLDMRMWEPQVDALRPPPIDNLHTVTAPTLVIVGEHDVPGFVEMADILATRIPGATLRRVPGAGHMVNLEAPGTVNRLLVEFLTSIPAPHRAEP